MSYENLNSVLGISPPTLDADYAIFKEVQPSVLLHYLMGFTDREEISIGMARKAMC